MKHKLSRRIGVLAIFMAFVLAVAACAVSYRVYTSTITEHYNTMAQNLSETLVTAVDKQDVTVLRELNQTGMLITAVSVKWNPCRNIRNCIRTFWNTEERTRPVLFTSVIRILTPDMASI